MKILLTSIALALTIISHSVAEELKADDQLSLAVNKAFAEAIDEKVINTIISRGLWNADKSAVAIWHHNRDRSVVHIFIRKATGEYLPVDVSKVEDGNIGKLGFKRSYYERFETEATEWIERKDSKLQVWMRTRAWKDGQRYAASEPLIIDIDGTVHWR